MHITFNTILNRIQPLTLKVVKTRLKQACHMIDRFHITQHLNEAVDEPRRKIPKIFLGNLADDKPELENYAEQHPEIVQRLMKLHEEWVKDIGK